MINEALVRAEYGIRDCKRLSACNGRSSCSVKLSSIGPGAKRRGSRDPRILLVTEAPDEDSSSGTAYQGGISGRIISIFTEDEYGIGLSKPQKASFQDFLVNKRIYATSAVKCYVDGSTQELGHGVLTNCKDEYLSEQIDAMPNLELIIPMGKVAAASLLERSASSFQITELVGSAGRGIVTEENPSRIIFPHPSGASPLSNAPIIRDDDSKSLIQNKNAFQNALRAVREQLDNMGYDVLDDDPDSWDSPGGLSSFV